MTEDQGRTINLALKDSLPGPAPHPYRAGAPNVLVVVLDDLGFGQLGCFGSDLDTPNIDALAATGLRFTNFHTTAVCSPTRACLLTGRNHHRVGMGMLPDLPVNYPGYTGQFPRSAGTLAQVLRAEGWSTAAIGKWHLVPRDQRATGPFHMWPTGLGFDRYYGFLNGETSQWTPNLVRDQSHVEPPRTPEEGYHLDVDLADEAIRQLRDLRVHNPARPFLLWYATAAPHAPHQVPAEWSDRYRGRFDDGWDVWRERTFARQKALGVVPEDAELSPRPPWVAAWVDLDAERRRLYSRMMEVFAGFLSHTDHHLGRVLAELDRSGQRDDTIVVLISDNGCSAEGGPNGSWNQLRHYLNDEPDDLAKELAHYDDLGGFRSSGHYPWGWALAGNTPFQRWKRYTFEGGVRDPLIVSWPGRIPDAGGVRTQYCHAVDIMPTLLDLLDVAPPDELDGVAQMSIDGASMAPLLTDPDALPPRTSQYYECWGSRAMYADGWKAVTNHVNQLTAAERDAIPGSAVFEDDEWYLFDTRTDFTEAHDLAAEHPDVLAALVEQWHEAARRNQVLPMDDGRDNRVAQMHLPWLHFQSSYELLVGDKLHESHAPILFGGFRMVARFSSGLEADASGVLCEQGDWMAGWAWFLRDGSLTWILSWNGEEHRITAQVPVGARVLVVDAVPRPGGGFDLRLTADDATIAEAVLPSPMPAAIAPDGAFLTVGYGRPFPVCDDYAPPAPAPESLVGIRIDVGPPPPFDFDAEIARVMRHQ